MYKSYTIIGGENLDDPKSRQIYLSLQEKMWHYNLQKTHHLGRKTMDAIK
jgi:hypothetical protein